MYIHLFCVLGNSLEIAKEKCNVQLARGNEEGIDRLRFINKWKSVEYIQLIPDLHEVIYIVGHRLGTIDKN